MMITEGGGEVEMKIHDRLRFPKLKAIDLFTEYVVYDG